MAELTLDTPELLKRPPTQAELPCDDGIPMETSRHQAQMQLLMEPIQLWLETQPLGFVGGNMFVYFSPDQVRNHDFKGPDVFVVLGVPKGERRSWVVWDEAKAPDVVIELLSESTAKSDKTEKKAIYQNRLRVPEYFWFDPMNPEDWAGFRLQGGDYQAIAVNAQGQLFSSSLGWGLVRWQGTYQGITTTWLRWTTPEGELLPISAEIAQQERERAEQERERAEQAEAQLRQVAVNLLQQGMPVAQVQQVTGLTTAQIEALV